MRPSLFSHEHVLLRVYGRADHGKGLFGIAAHRFADGVEVFLIGHGSHDSRLNTRLLAVTADGALVASDQAGRRMEVPHLGGAFPRTPYEDRAEGLYTASGSEGRSWWLNCDPHGTPHAPVSVVRWDGVSAPDRFFAGPSAHTRALLVHQGIIYAHNPTRQPWPGVFWAREDAPEFAPLPAREAGDRAPNVILALVPFGERVVGFSAQLPNQAGAVSDNPPYFVIEPDRTAVPLAFSDAEVWGADLEEITEVAGRRFRVFPQVLQGFPLPGGLYLVTTSGLFVLEFVGERPRRVHAEADGAFFATGGRLYRVREGALERWAGDRFETVERLATARARFAAAAYGAGRLVWAGADLVRPAGEPARVEITIQGWDLPL